MVANVYAPCDPDAKQGLWDALSSRLQSLVGMRVCVCGDFNAVRNTPERRSTSAGQRPLDQLGFNHFIDDNFLVDLPLGGRKYTWCSGLENHFHLSYNEVAIDVYLSREGKGKYRENLGLGSGVGYARGRC
ncbi:hypothetical protein QL285_086291 [Trifolium repens]|nr:hypothetical protein QL285_086291 [Trifolium repens]